MKSKEEFKKLSKDELVDLCHRDQFLATTVEAKDKELSDLRKVKSTMEDDERNGLLGQLGNMETRALVYLELAEKAIARYRSLIKVLEGVTDTSVELLEYAEIILETNKPQQQ